MCYVGLGEGVRRQTVTFNKNFYMFSKKVEVGKCIVHPTLSGEKDLENNMDHDYFQVLMCMDDKGFAVILVRFYNEYILQEGIKVWTDYCTRFRTAVESFLLLSSLVWNLSSS